MKKIKGGKKKRNDVERSGWMKRGKGGEGKEGEKSDSLVIFCCDKS